MMWPVQSPEHRASNYSLLCATPLVNIGGKRGCPELIELTSHEALQAMRCRRRTARSFVCLQCGFSATRCLRGLPGAAGWGAAQIWGSQAGGRAGEVWALGVHLAANMRSGR